jgi:hypothetical protein
VTFTPDAVHVRRRCWRRRRRGRPQRSPSLTYEQPQRISIKVHDPLVGVSSTRYPSLYRMQPYVMPTR